MEDRTNPLVEAYLTRGPNSIRQVWREVYETNQNDAVNLINDPSIPFPILYTLAPELFGQSHQLSVKNSIAMNHIFTVLKGDPFGLLDDYDLIEQNYLCIDCFNWILKTGGFEEIDDNYSLVIDHVCILLLQHFKMDCLSDVVDVLFYRHRTGGQRHYILSTFYDTGDPKGIIFVAKYLRSQDPLDVALAKNILAFIPDVAFSTPRQGEQIVLTWLEENQTYLIFTSENNDSHPYPNPFLVNYAAKYFGIPISPMTGTAIYPIDKEIKDEWKVFQSLPIHVQNHLSTYSLRLRRWNRLDWKQWILTPVTTHAKELAERLRR